MALPIDNNIKQPKKQGTGFTNIQRLMQANQSNRLGETVASGVGGQVQRVNQDLGKSQNKFNQEAGKQRIDFQANQQKAGQVLSNISNVTDDDAKAFEKIRTGQYTGPQALENIDQIKTQAVLAGQLGQLGNTAGGKTELLKRFAGGPQYTTGQSRLDSLLLGTSGAPQLKAARREAQILGNQVASADINAQEQSKGLKNQIQDLGKQTVQNLRSKTDELYQSIDKKKADYLAQQEADMKEAFESAETGEFTQRMLDKLGLKAGQHIGGIDYKDLFGTVNQDLNQYNLADQDQAMKLAALGKLAGSSFDNTEIDALSKYAGNKDVGTADLSKTIKLGTDDLNARFERSLQDSRALLDQGDTLMGQAVNVEKEFNDRHGVQLGEQLARQDGRAAALRAEGQKIRQQAIKQLEDSKKTIRVK